MPGVQKPVSYTHLKEGYEEYWIAYNTEYFSAKELTIFPRTKVTIREDAAYGLIVIEGRGKFGILEVETPTMIRFGQMTKDELFVTQEAAVNGITIVNESENENLVICLLYTSRCV